MVSMETRALTQAIEALAFARHKIGLVSGPRQCGKTTLAKMLLQRRETGLYRDWDEVEFGDTKLLVAGAAEGLSYFA
jgi:predicted AAA+ superfamily ATPase